MEISNVDDTIFVGWLGCVEQANRDIKHAISNGVEHVMFCDTKCVYDAAQVTNVMQKRADAFEKNGFVESWENGLLLCKIELFCRYGLLDESCSNLYSAVAAFIEKVNEFGYSLVDVYGKLSDDFNPGQRLWEAFKDTAEDKSGKPRLLLEFSNMNPFHCGTSEYQLALLKYFHRLYEEKYDIIVRCNQAAVDFHRMYDLAQKVCLPEDDIPVCDIALVASQPVDAKQQEFLNSHALRVVYTMLDCILLRTGYLVADAPRIQDTVRAGLRYADGILAISKFSEADYKNYFIRDSMIPQKSSRVVYIATDFGNGLSDSSIKKSLPFDEYVLVIGNHYKHKALKEVLALAQYDGRNYIFVGLNEEGMLYPNVMSYRTALLDEAFLNGLYENCSCVVFPSQYEGFGLPITIALKHKKPVVVSDNVLNREIASYFSEHESQISFFERFEEIPEMVERALGFQGEVPCFCHSWQEAIIEVEDYLFELLDKPVDWELLDERMWYYRSIQTERESAYFAGKESVGIKQLAKERVRGILRLSRVDRSN